MLLTVACAAPSIQLFLFCTLLPGANRLTILKKFVSCNIARRFVAYQAKRRVKMTRLKKWGPTIITCCAGASALATLHSRAKMLLLSFLLHLRAKMHC